jgi:hypothetical protein
MQMDIQTAEPLVPEPSLVEVEIAIGKWWCGEKFPVPTGTRTPDLPLNYSGTYPKVHCHV